MAEPLSLTLSLLPIAMGVLKGYREALKPLRNYRDYEKTLVNINMNLFIQHEQLTLTLFDFARKTAPAGHPAGHQAVTSLHGAGALLRDRLDPESYSSYMFIIKHMANTMEKIRKKLEIGLKDGQLAQPKWMGEGAARVSWEWNKIQTSFGYKERAEAFQELRRWNDQLRECLQVRIRGLEIPPPGQPSHFDEAFCDGVRSNATILHQTLAEAWSGSCPDIPHTSSVDMTWHQQGLSCITGLILSFPEPEAFHVQSHSDSFRRQVSVKIEQVDFENQPEPELEPGPVYLCGSPGRGSRGPPPKRQRLSRLFGSRRKSSTHTPQQSSPLPSTQASFVPSDNLQLQVTTRSDRNTETVTKEAAPEKISSLCHALSKQDAWSGYLLHPEEVNKRVVLERKSASGRLSAVCLKDSLVAAGRSRLFQTAAVTRSQPPVMRTRRSRYSIAAATSWAVLLLCGTPWLEQTWLSADELVILVDQTAQTSNHGTQATDYISIPRPALSHTFLPKSPAQNQVESSQSRGETLVPEDQFQSNQVKHKTLFTLAILLIQLGLNRTFDQIRAEACQITLFAENARTQNSVVDDYAIASMAIDAVHGEVGDDYANAVRRCLECHFLCPSGARDFDHRSFRKQFYYGVVAPVQATFDRMAEVTWDSI